ncbi:hypothetical protein [Curtobacterium sp. Leaf261]|uniref:hypothetical protein n=1 Tax=Curtobacterium sp. Leaf261 TaxID=1736311 RepID=UPI000ABA786A|nr:hypothetical protein [Curtobacterium sp. Leaf261]
MPSLQSGGRSRLAHAGDLLRQVGAADRRAIDAAAARWGRFAEVPVSVTVT